MSHFGDLLHNVVFNTVLGTGGKLGDNTISDQVCYLTRWPLDLITQRWSSGQVGKKCLVHLKYDFFKKKKCCCFDEIDPFHMIYMWMFAGRFPVTHLVSWFQSLQANKQSSNTFCYDPLCCKFCVKCYLHRSQNFQELHTHAARIAPAFTPVWSDSCLCEMSGFLFSCNYNLLAPHQTTTHFSLFLTHQNINQPWWTLVWFEALLMIFLHSSYGKTTETMKSKTLRSLSASLSIKIQQRSWNI